jgi:quercetin dioxygenase-like cupin family protein
MTGYLDPAADEQEALWYFGGLRLITALGERLEGALRVKDFVTPAGTRIFAHRREDEALYALAGDAIVASMGQTFTIRAGTFLFLPSDVPYSKELGASGPLHYLTWLTLAGFTHDILQIGDPRHPLLLAPPRAPSSDKIQCFADLLRVGQS